MEFEKIKKSSSKLNSWSSKPHSNENKILTITLLRKGKKNCKLVPQVSLLVCLLGLWYDLCSIDL